MLQGAKGNMDGDEPPVLSERPVFVDGGIHGLVGTGFGLQSVPVLEHLPSVASASQWSLEKSGSLLDICWACN